MRFDKIGFEQWEERSSSCIDDNIAGVLISTKLIIHKARTRCKISFMYIYISRTYIFVRKRACTDIYIYTYTDVLGTEIWRTPSTRLDLRLFNSSACQKHQCTLCSLIVLFPFLSFSVLLTFARSLSIFSLFLPFRILRPFSLFSLLRIYPGTTLFCLSSSRTVPLS